MTRCSITCMEPGCKTPIFYDTETDIEVPLYCERHRTYDGRHSAVRDLVKPEPEPEPIALVVMRCPACKTRKTVPKPDWMENKVVCDCGKMMVYHKDG